MDAQCRMNFMYQMAMYCHDQQLPMQSYYMHQLWEMGLKSRTRLDRGIKIRICKACKGFKRGVCRTRGCPRSIPIPRENAIEPS